MDPSIAKSVYLAMGRDTDFPPEALQAARSKFEESKDYPAAVAAARKIAPGPTDELIDQNPTSLLRQLRQLASTSNPIREKRPKLKDFGDLVLNPNAASAYLAEFVESPAKQKKLYFITIDEILIADVIIAVIWIVMAIVFAAYFVPWAYGLLKPGCPSVNGQVCNGAPNFCGDFGQCVCRNPLFSGPDCGDSIVPGYVKNQPLSACYNRGIGSPTMTYANVIEECRWNNPTISNPIGSGGWLEPACIARIDQIRAQRDALVAARNFDAVSQLDGVASVPTCLCYDAWDGIDCQESACPYDSARQICSNHGLNTVGLFYNDTTTGDGCQSLDTFSFFNSTIQESLSDEARVQIQNLYLEQLYRPFSGVPIFNEGSLVTVVKTGAFGCICKSGRFGIRCQLGGCPIGDNGLECSGNGDGLYGAGVLRNTTVSENEGRVGVIKCAQNTRRCLSNICGPYSPLEFDHSKWCVVGESSRSENKWRCADGSLVSDRFPNCDAGFTTATLNPDQYDSLRSTVLCDLRSIDGYERCFGALNQTEIFFAENEFTELQNFVVTKSTPIVAFVVQGKNPTLQNQTIRITTDGYDETFVVENNFAVYGTLETSQSRFLLDQYVSTNWDVTVQIFDDRITVSPYPYFDVSIRDEWKRFRLLSRQNEYVECVGQIVQTVLSDLVPNTNVTISVGDDLVATTGPNPVALDVCLTDPSTCIFWFNGTFLVNNETNLFVCNTATSYTFSQTPCLPTTSTLQTATMVLVARNLVEITSTNAYAPLNWIFQQTRPSIHTLFFNASALLQLLTLEIVQLSDVVRPCLCLEPINTRNQSELNSKWFNQRERVRSVYQPQQRVVVPFSDFGVPNFYRGSIVSSDELSSVVSVFGFGNVLVGTSDLRSISNDQFLEGLPDYAVEAYYAKCPTGQNAHAVANLLELDDTCFCTRVGNQIECACSAKNQTCVCTAVAGADPSCDCNDPLLETPLQSSINATNDCFCFVSDYAPIEPFVTSFDSLDVSTGVERPIIAFEFDECFTVDQIIAYDARSDSADSIEFVVACTGSMQIQPLNSAYSFGRYVFVTSANYSGPTRVHWSPIGFPVASLANITWTASSNQQNASLVQTFDSFHWSSDKKYERQWIQAEFNQSVNVAGVNLILSDGALHVATFVPVEFELWGFANEWVLLQTFLVSATPTESQQFALNVSRTISKIRIESPLGFTVRLFSPVVDSWCACADPNVQVQINRPYPDISTNEIWTSLEYILEHTTNESCVALNACELTPPGGQTFLKNTTGQCNDLRNWLIVNGVTETVTERFETWAILSWLEFYLQWFPNSTTSVQTTSEFQNLNISGTITNQTFWCVFIVSCQISYEDAWIAYQAGNQTFEQTAFLFITLDNIVFNQEPCFYDSGAQQLVFGAFTNVTEYSAPIPTGTVCPSGYDLINCGKSNRDVAALPNVDCFLNETLNVFYQSLLNQTTPSAFRPLSTFLENGATINVTHSVAHSYLTFGSSCTQQTCPFFRCRNGACVDFANECDDRYDVPGSGCVANDLNARLYSCACALGFDGPACDVQDTQPVTNPFDQLRNPYLDNKCGAPGPMRVNQAFAPVETGRVKNTPSIFLTVNRAVNRRRCSCVTGQVCECNDVHQYQIQMTHAPWQPIFEFLQTTVNGEQILSYVFPNHLTRTGSYANIYTDVQVYNPRTRQATYTVYYDNDLNPYSYFYNTTKYELTLSERPIPCANGQPAGVRSECALLEKLYPTCNGKGTCQGGGYCKCLPGWRTMVFTTPYSQSIQIPYTSRLFEGQYVPVPTDFYGDPNWNWLYFGPSWCLDKDCTQQDCSVPTGCFPGTKEANFRDAYVSCGPQYPNKCAPSRQLCLQARNLTDPPVCSGKGIKLLVDYTNETVCYCGDPISRTATIDQIDSIAQLKPNGFAGPACNVRQCNVGPIYFLRRDPHTNAPFTDLGKQIYGRWFAYCEDDPKKPAPFVGANPTDKEVWQKCCGSETRLERCVNQPCVLNNQNLCLPGDVCLARGGTGRAQVCNGQGTPNADGTCDCSYDALSGGYGADYAVFSRPNCYKRVLCAISRQTGTACGAANQQAIYRPKRVLNLPDPLFINGQSEAGLARIGLSPTNNTLIPLVTTFEQMNQVLVQSSVNQITQLNIANGSLYGCYCIYPNQSCDALETMVDYCGSPIQYDQAYRSPFLLNYTTNLSLSSDTDFYISFPRPQDVIDLSAGVDVFLPQAYTITTINLWIRSNATSTSVQVDVLTEDNQVVCPPLAIATNTNWTIETIYCEPLYQDYDFYAQGGTIQRSVIQNCGPPNSELSVTTACVDFQRETCTAVGGIYSDPGSLTRLRGCSLNRCCVLTQNFASQTVNRFRVVGQAQIQIMNVFGFSDVTQPLADIFVLETYYRSGFLAASQRPDQKVMQFYWGSDKTFWAPGDVIQNCSFAQLSACSPFNNTQTFLNFTDAVRSAKRKGGYLATSNDPVLASQSDPRDPALAEPLNTRPADKQYQAGWISVRNTEYNPNAGLSAYVQPSCDLGCRTVTNYRAVPFGLYSARDFSQWSTKWNGALLDNGWLAYFRSLRIAPFDSYMASFEAVQTNRIGAWGQPGQSSTTQFNPWNPNTQFVPIGGSGRSYTPNYDSAEWVSQRGTECIVTLYQNPFCRDPASFVVDTSQPVLPPKVCSNYVYNADGYLGAATRFNVFGAVMDTRNFFDSADQSSNAWAFGVDLDDIFRAWPDRYTAWGGNYAARGIVVTGRNCRVVATAYDDQALTVRSPNSDVIITLDGNGQATVQGGGFLNGDLAAQFGSGCSLCTSALGGTTSVQYTRTTTFFGSQEARSIIPSSVTRGYKIQLFSTIDWVKQSTWIEAEQRDPGLSSNQRFGAEGPSRSRTLGWLNQPYMCQGIQTRLIKLLPAYNNPSYPGGFLRYFANQNPQFLGTNFINFPNKQLRGSYWIGNVNDFSALDYPSPTFTWPLFNPSVPVAAGGLATCASLGRPITLCQDCQITQNARYFANQLVYPRFGDVFVKQTTMLIIDQTVTTNRNSYNTFVSSVFIGTNRVATSNPLVLRFARPNGLSLLANVGDGSTYLHKLFESTNRDDLAVATNQACSLRIEDFATKWTQANCGAVDKNEGVMFAYPCENEIAQIVQIDYTKGTAFPGSLCDIDGSSLRTGGAPNLRTCFDLFPQLNQSANPYPFYLKQKFDEGTLAFTLTVGANAQDFDSAREFLDQIRYNYAEAIPGVRQAIDNGVSTQPGALSRGQFPDPVSFVNFDFSQIWPTFCGLKCSQFTGECSYLIAKSFEFCDIDLAIQLEQLNATDREQIPLNQLPSVLLPFDQTTGDPKLSVQCGTAIFLQRWFEFDTYGAPTQPEGYEIADLNPLKFIVRALNGTVANTGKNPAQWVFNNKTSYVSGTITLEQTESAATVDVWIAPLSFVYEIRDRIYVGSVAVTTTASYSFTVAVTNETVYQVVGFDFVAPLESVVTITNPIISTDESITQCLQVHGQLPKYQPLDVVRVDYPDHQCVANEDQLPYTPNTDIGECFCDPHSGQGGVACDASVVQTQRGRLIGAGYNTSGLAIDPNGDLQPVDQDGTYCFQRDGDTICYTKTFDAARAVLTKLSLTTFAYPAIFRLETLYGANSFLTISTSGWITFAEAEDAATENNRALPALVNADVVDDFVEVFTAPVFMALQLDESNGYWFWTDRGVQLADSNSSVPVFENYICDSASLCASLNFNNVIYGTTGNFMTDGSIVLAAFTTQSVAVNTPGTYWVYVFTDVARTLSGCSTTTAVASNTNLGMITQKFVCVVTTTATLQPLPSGNQVAELQVFQALDTTRTSAYGTYP